MEENKNGGLLQSLLFSGGGSGGGGTTSLIVTETDGALDKTWSEIKTAIESGKNVVIHTSYSDSGETTEYSLLVISVYVKYQADVDPYYACLSMGELGAVVYSTDNENGYPGH